jgi:uncharacterized protein (TIGR03435 family)
MSKFASDLRFLTGRAVSDETSLSGRFDVKLEFAQEGGQGPSVVASDQVSLFTARQTSALRFCIRWGGTVISMLVVTGVVGLPAQGTSAVTQKDPKSGVDASFEVASIRLSDPRATRRAIDIEPSGRLHALNVPITRLITFAYGVQHFQIAGGPDWARSELFDVTASLSAGGTGSQQMTSAMRILLADRFKLVVRRETRELDVYVLSIARADRRLGPTLKPARTDCSPEAVAARRAAARSLPSSRTPAADRPGTCGIIGTGDPTRFRSEGVTMSEFASLISGQTGRVVVDQTELPGYWEFELIYAVRPIPGTDSPSVFTAVQEDLGLRLRPAKAPVEVLVIEQLERPTPNWN